MNPACRDRHPHNPVSRYSDRGALTFHCDGALAASEPDPLAHIETMGDWWGHLDRVEATGEPVLPDPPPSTTKVPLHKLVGHALPGLDWKVTDYYSNGKAYTAGGPRNLKSTFTVDEHGMVEVSPRG